MGGMHSVQGDCGQPFQGEIRINMTDKRFRRHSMKTTKVIPRISDIAHNDF